DAARRAVVARGQDHQARAAVDLLDLAERRLPREGLLGGEQEGVEAARSAVPSALELAHARDQLVVGVVELVERRVVRLGAPDRGLHATAHDVDVPRRHSSSVAEWHGERWRECLEPRTSVTALTDPQMVDFKAFDARGYRTVDVLPPPEKGCEPCTRRFVGI